MEIWKKNTKKLANSHRTVEIVRPNRVMILEIKWCSAGRGKLDREKFFRAFLLSFLLLHPMLIAGAFLIIWSITGCPPPFGGSALAFLLGNTASVAPVTPGGLGTRDKVIEVVLTAVGVEPSAASLTPILYSIAMLSSGLAGIVFFLLDMGLTKRENEK